MSYKRYDNTASKVDVIILQRLPVISDQGAISLQLLGCKLAPKLVYFLLRKKLLKV